MKKLTMLLMAMIFALCSMAQQLESPIDGGFRKSFEDKQSRAGLLDSLFWWGYISTGFYLVYIPGGGYAPGININNDIACAERFEVSLKGVINQAILSFGAKTGNGAITITVWEDDQGYPGNVIRRQTLPLNQIDTGAPMQNHLTNISFVPPVAIPYDKTFWMGLEYFNKLPGDTVGLLTFNGPQTGVYNLIQLQNSSFISFFDYTGWNYQHAITAVVEYLQAFSSIEGNVFYDLNHNSIRDTNEPGVSNQLMAAGNLCTATDHNGDYSLDVYSPGTYFVKPIIQSYLTASPDSISAQILTEYVFSYGNNFACQIVPNVRDVSVSLFAGTIRPGFQSPFYINYKNKGTQTENCTVTLTFDSQLSLIDSDPAYSSMNFNTISWTIPNVSPGGTGTIRIVLEAPVFMALGSTSTSFASINPIVGDSIPLNNQDTIENIVMGSFDPNAKRVDPEGSGSQGSIDGLNTWFDYTIEFQNTGTDTAFNIILKDTIDGDLDMTTLEILAASHPYSYTVNSSGELTFFFNNILLPDSGANQVLSNGFISYRIKVKSGLPNYTEIENTAFIYFDYNLPVATNTTLNTILYASIEKNLETKSCYRVFPNPSNGNASIYLDNKINLENSSFEIINLLGEMIIINNNISDPIISLQNYELRNGTYFFRLTLSSGEVISGDFIISK